MPPAVVRPTRRTVLINVKVDETLAVALAERAQAEGTTQEAGHHAAPLARRACPWSAGSGGPHTPPPHCRSMSDYDTDILLWSERQAELLRRRAAGELVNDTELDWSNIAEEIEGVGRSQLHAVKSLLVKR